MESTDNASFVDSGVATEMSAEMDYMESRGVGGGTSNEQQAEHALSVTLSPTVKMEGQESSHICEDVQDSSSVDYSELQHGTASIQGGRDFIVSTRLTGMISKPATKQKKKKGFKEILEDNTKHIDNNTHNIIQPFPSSPSSATTTHTHTSSSSSSYASTSTKIHAKPSYICQICQKCFLYQRSLHRHLKVHTGNRPFICSVCNKDFVEMSSLKVHMALHLGNRPYKCTDCGKTFTLRGHLHAHQRTHTGERPYQCPFCQKWFKESGYLKKHVRIHTGVKPYRCYVCDKMFSITGSLKSHLKTHQKEEEEREGWGGRGSLGRKKAVTNSKRVEYEACTTDTTSTTNTTTVTFTATCTTDTTSTNNTTTDTSTAT